MVRRPQTVFAKITGLDWGYRTLTRALPLRRGEFVERDGRLYALSEVAVSPTSLVATRTSESRS
jgi:hypothetical protein